MKEKLRMILAVTGIFLLLPLLLTVFLSGREVLRIKKQWNMESLLPMMMCREIPWEYEEEMKKVQAVLTRSSLYLRIEETGMDGEDWEKLWREVKAAQHQKGYQQAYRSMEQQPETLRGRCFFTGRRFVRVCFTGSAAVRPVTGWKCLERWRKAIFSVWTATGICMGRAI
ncbi:hypothetical protein DW962_11040 [Blautia sp. AM46-5]|nr:hypothetical protein DW962_11040 [Blautia sp. AM46-5]RHS56888.1 hypothetical protein DW961_08510 [Blautia sp. AM46-3MH]